MISGNFGDEDELFFEIELIAANSLALFDTGFSWWLAINNQDLEALDFCKPHTRDFTSKLGAPYFHIFLPMVVCMVR
jgi:predicted aspartyl protease